MIFTSLRPVCLQAMAALLMLVSFGAAAHAQAAADPEDSVVRVFNIVGKDAAGEPMLVTGSGVLVEGRRQVLTNDHVTKDAVHLLLGFLSNDGEVRLVPATLHWASEDYDLAIVTASEDLPLQPMLFADIPMPRSNRPRDTLPKKGADVTAIGFPGESDELSMAGPSAFDPTQSYGKVQRVVPFAANGRWVIQHSADIAAGNSGGPLINECGELLGINTWENRQHTRNLATHSSEVEDALRRANVTPQKASVPCGTKPPPPEPEPAKDAKPSASAPKAKPSSVDEKSKENIRSFGYLIGYLLPLAAIGLLVIWIVRRSREKSVRADASSPERPAAAPPVARPVPPVERSRPSAPPPASKGSHATLLLSDLSGARLGRFDIESDIYDNGEIRLGRDPGKNQLTLSDATVSRQHCRIFVTDNGNLFVEDLGSSNGTFVNGKRCRPEELAGPLSDGDRLKLGDFALIVRLQ